MACQTISCETLTSYEDSVGRCMAAAGAESLLRDGRPVMLKPNLINASPHPVTTPPAFCAAVIGFVRQHTDAPIVIAEGCGDAHLETPEVFRRLGYKDLAEDLGVELLDLNTAPLSHLTDAACGIFPEMWLPCAVFEHVLISLPVLKAHSLCRLTGSMKNMMGMAPPGHYGGRCGSWKKAAFHPCLDAAIVALNRYRTPDFTVMDATIGLADYHLGGPCCQPPVNRILAGRDARALDREAARLLGMDWQGIGYLGGAEA
jgi:uncharacterized protein (DUF362 family)